MLNALFYGVLAWYLDAVIKGMCVGLCCVVCLQCSCCVVCLHYSSLFAALCLFVCFEGLGSENKL